RHRIIERALVGDLNKARAFEQALGEFGSDAKALAYSIGERLGKAAHSDRAELAPVVELQASLGDAAKAVRLFQDGLEYRRDISGRRIDDLQDLGGRDLPLQRFLGLVEQPGVFDGDHRLGSERLQQLDMMGGKQARGLPAYRDRAN